MRSRLVTTAVLGLAATAAVLAAPGTATAAPYPYPLPQTPCGEGQGPASPRLVVEPETEPNGLVVARVLFDRGQTSRGGYDLYAVVTEKRLDGTEIVKHLRPRISTFPRRSTFWLRRIAPGSTATVQMSGGVRCGGLEGDLLPQTGTATRPL